LGFGGSSGNSGSTTPQSSSVTSSLAMVPPYPLRAFVRRTKAYELVATGELPAVRIGRCIRVNRRKLDEWLLAQRYLNVTK